MIKTKRYLLYDFIYKNFGEWSIAGLDDMREEYVFESIKAEICSKKQQYFITLMEKKDTRYIEWNCAFCATKISVNACKKRILWKELLCSNCKNAKFDNELTRNILAFQRHVQNTIAKNLQIEEL